MKIASGLFFVIAVGATAASRRPRPCIDRLTVAAGRTLIDQNEVTACHIVRLIVALGNLFCAAKGPGFPCVRQRSLLWLDLCRYSLSEWMLVEGLMSVESDYRGYRIEVAAVQVEGVWDAEVKIRRAQSKATTCFGRLTCRKPSARVAEQRGALCAHDWIDRHGQS